MKIVDSTNPMPKYLQISTWLKELIQVGRYRAGEKLPAETQLAKICGVNRNTLRHAIAELITMGLVQKKHGTGTFVTPHVHAELRHKLNRIESFTDLMRDSGFTQQTKIIKKNVQSAPKKVARALQLSPGRKVVTVRRVRLGNGIPLIYEESYLPHDIFKGILQMDLSGSIYKIISEHFQVALARCKQTIRAVNIDENIASILSVPPDYAGIFMTSLSFNENSLPIEVLYSWHRGDRYKVEIELDRYHAGSNKIKFLTEIEANQMATFIPAMTVS